MKLSIKKIITILLVGIAFLFFLSIITTTKTQKSKTTNPNFIPTPTQFFIKNLSVSENSPTTDTASVSIIDKPSLTFSRDLSQIEQEQIKITASPPVDGTIIWKDSKTVVFNPTTSFKDNQTYTITASSLNQVYSWNFTTGSEDDLSESQVRALQARLDIQTANERKALLQQYPWYPSLPLSSNDYFVYFDDKAKIFYADLYVNKNDTSKINDLKKQINQELTSLGVDTSLYRFSYNIP